MFFQLIPTSGALWVEGVCDSPNVGEFAGHVVAIGLQEYDPIASPRGERPDPGHEPEGLAGWGTTHFLVCDTDKPAPVWVAKTDVHAHRYTAAGAEAESAAPRGAGTRSNGA